MRQRSVGQQQGERCKSRKPSPAAGVQHHKDTPWLHRDNVLSAKASDSRPMETSRYNT